MLLDKYSPKSTKEIFNKAAVMEIKKWLSSWKKGRALLVYGPTGSGKSIAVQLIGQELGYELVETYADEKRPLKDFLQVSVQQGVFSKKKILLFEDIETMAMRGFSQLIKKSEHPIICTTNDAYKLPAYSRKLFRLMKFDKISDTDLVRFLETICKHEHIVLQHRDLEQLAKMSNGDMRALLIDLESLRLGFKHGDYRDIEENIFNTMKVIFKARSIENSRIAAENSEKDGEELFRWLEQNVAEEYTDMNAIARAYNYLSKADIFYSRILRRQSWSLQKYFLNLSVYGTSLAKGRPSVRFVSYKPPVFFKTYNALEKLAGALHVSKKQAAVYIPIVRMLVKKNSNICEDLGMDEKEASFVTGE